MRQTGVTRNGVLIAGGGIAGLSCAIALRRAGILATVFEARPSSDAGAGVFLTLAANGLRALRTMGVEPGSLGGFDTPRIALYLSDGTRLTEFPTAPARDDGLVAQTVRRSDAYAALRTEAVQAGAVIHYERRVVAARDLPKGVEVEFQDGETQRGALLVGADGVHSQVRRIVDGRASTPAFTGLMNTAGIVSGVEVEGEPGTMRMYFGRRAFFSYLPRGNGEVWWFANPPTAAARDRDRSQWKERLARMFAGDDFPARKLILATENVCRPWPTYELLDVPVWHRGAMIIIGDAAHAASPSSGQGASMAFEDSLELARCLRDHAELPAALRRFEDLRRQRVRRVVKQGQHNSGGKMPGPFGRVVRDAFLRVWFRARPGCIENLRWLYDFHIDWNESSKTASATRS